MAENCDKGLLWDSFSACINNKFIIIGRNGKKQNKINGQKYKLQTLRKESTHGSLGPYSRIERLAFVNIEFASTCDENKQF